MNVFITYQSNCIVVLSLQYNTVKAMCGYNHTLLYYITLTGMI